MANPVMMIGDNPACGIQKRLISPGKGDLPSFVDNDKVRFHYVTRLCDDEHTLVDDSRKIDKPFELILGKKFKLEVWETCVKSMRVGEVASFTVQPALAGAYPVVSRSLRDLYAGKPASTSHHCCGAAMHEQGLGYADLDALMKQPQSLEFIIELLQVEEAGGYKKDVWAMNEDEKMREVPLLREQGNALFRDKQYTAASDCYGKAIGILEQLLLREKPNQPEWVDINNRKLPLLLNFAQCKLSQGEYYQVIEHTTEVLKYQPENAKALYRRAKAYVGAWDPELARADFEKLRQVDASLEKTVAKELKSIDEKVKEKEKQDREKLQGKLFT